MAPMGCPTYVKVNPPNYNTTPTTLHSPPLKSEILFQMIPRKKTWKKIEFSTSRSDSNFGAIFF